MFRNTSIKFTITVLLCLLALSLSMTALAQQITPTDDAEINPDANISWPPPVYVLRGEVDLYGTANVSNMTNYFIEFRPIENLSEESEEAEDDEEPLWFPVTLPNTAPVQEDVLGTWNTETTEDGLYEIRLTVNASGQPATFFVVSPIRIENDPPAFVVDDLPTQQPVVQATPTRIRPTLAPSPTAVDTTPRVTARLNANVRRGDNTSYPAIGQLLVGQTARVIGVSSSGSGWYYIEMPDGDRGFIAASTVDASGDLGSVPRIDPPATPTPVPTNTPIPTGNLTGSLPDLDPDQPTCNEQFQVLVNITNAGTAATGSTATVTISDVHVGTGQIQSTVSRDIPPLDPGENFVVGGQFIISTFFNEEHQIVVRIDTTNNVIETREDDNVLTANYTLQRGSC